MVKLGFQTFVKRPIVFPALLYSMIYLLSTVFSINPIVSWFGLGDQRGLLTSGLVLLLFFLALLTIQTRRELNRVVDGLIMGSIAVSIYGWMQLLGLDLLHWRYDSRSLIFIHSTFARNIYLGAYLAMVIPFTLSRIDGLPLNKRPERFGYILVLFVQLSCLFLAFARSAAIGLTGGIIAYFLSLSSKNDLRKKLTILIILVAGFGIVYSIFYRYIPLLYFRTGYQTYKVDISTYQEISNTSRFLIWKRTLDIIPKRWFLGYGPETFQIALASQIPISEKSVPIYIPRDPHNLFLYQLTALGVAGLFSLLWVIVQFYRNIIPKIQKCHDAQSKLTLAAIFSSVTAYVVQTQFNPESIVTLTYFWLFMALGSMDYD